MKIVILLLALTVSGCARDDGAGDLWKIVKHCNEGRCK